MTAPAPSSDASHTDSPESATDPASSDAPSVSDAESTGDPDPNDTDAAGDHLSKVTVGIHFATNRQGQLRARLLRTQDGEDRTDLSTLLDGFPPEDVIVRGRIQTELNLNALFAEGLFADRSLNEHDLNRRSVEEVDRIQREDAIPLRDGSPADTDSTYDLTPDTYDDPPRPEAVRVAIPFMTDHAGAVCARLDLNSSLQDVTDADAFEDVFASGKALVRGKVRADVNLEALFDARIVDGTVDPGTMYMPPDA